MWWCQGLLLYLPHSGTTLKRRALKFNDAGYQSPEEYKLPYEDVYIRVSEHIRVHAWFCPQAPALAAKSPTVVLFHGNAGNIGYEHDSAINLLCTITFSIFHDTY